MIFSVRSCRRVLPFLAALVFLTGCPQPEGSSDEEREPHFMEGKRCANSMDYSGAVEQFEKALEVNPKNAAAHFELGVLFDQRQDDPAAAIYHYQKYLKLNPKGPQAELATTHILACKQQLARTVSLGPVTQTMEAEFQKLSEQNKKLTEENRALHDELDKWKGLAARLQAAATNPVVVTPPTPRSNAEPSAAQPPREAHVRPPVETLASVSPPSNALSRPAVSPARVKRTHVVKSGETLATIARRYGIRLDALKACNPGLDPRRLRVGQTLNLP